MMHQVNTPDHDYISTACHHGEHDECRQECKFCPAACDCVCHQPAPPKPASLLLLELYRSGRGHHRDPKKSKPREQQLLWSCYVGRDIGVYPPMLVTTMKNYPYGYHWTVTDTDGAKLLGVAINEWLPNELLAKHSGG